MLGMSISERANVAYANATDKFSIKLELPVDGEGGEASTRQNHSIRKLNFNFCPNKRKKQGFPCLDIKWVTIFAIQFEINHLTKYFFDASTRENLLVKGTWW